MSPSINTSAKSVSAGSCDKIEVVCEPVAGKILKSIIYAPGLAFVCIIASLRLSGPESLVLITVKVADFPDSTMKKAMQIVVKYFVPQLLIRIASKMSVNFFVIGG